MFRKHGFEYVQTPNFDAKFRNGIFFETRRTSPFFTLWPASASRTDAMAREGRLSSSFCVAQSSLLLEEIATKQQNTMGLHTSRFCVAQSSLLLNETATKKRNNTGLHTGSMIVAVNVAPFDRSICVWFCSSPT